jgi:hypothetical protein
VFGFILVDGVTNNINYVGGNWLQSVEPFDPAVTTINTRGAPFAVRDTTVINPATGLPTPVTQIAVLDPTTFALADRSVVNFTGNISLRLPHPVQSRHRHPARAPALCRRLARRL